MQACGHSPRDIAPFVEPSRIPDSRRSHCSRSRSHSSAMPARGPAERSPGRASHRTRAPPRSTPTRAIHERERALPARYERKRNRCRGRERHRCHPATATCGARRAPSATPVWWEVVAGVVPVLARGSMMAWPQNSANPCRGAVRRTATPDRAAKADLFRHPADPPLFASGRASPWRATRP